MDVAAHLFPFQKHLTHVGMSNLYVYSGPLTEQTVAERRQCEKFSHNCWCPLTEMQFLSITRDGLASALAYHQSSQM